MSKIEKWGIKILRCLQNFKLKISRFLIFFGLWILFSNFFLWATDSWRYRELIKIIKKATFSVNLDLKNDSHALQQKPKAIFTNEKEFQLKIVTYEVIAEPTLKKVPVTIKNGQPFVWRERSCLQCHLAVVVWGILINNIVITLFTVVKSNKEKVGRRWKQCKLLYSARARDL